MRHRLIIFSILFSLSNTIAFAENTITRKIGVLAFRGESHALKRWSPTAEYLSNTIDGYTFTVVPLNLTDINNAIKNNDIDFVITNTGNYVAHEAKYGINRIATLKTLRHSQPYTKFGAVIFTRADRQDIKTLSDLRNKSFMAVNKNAFGGFQMAWRELEASGLDPFEDFSVLRFSGFPQDSVVYAVKDGIVDAGTIRTDLLEKMAAEGKINLKTFRILNQMKTPGFPFVHSTRLYPEWPFSKLKHTSENLAQQVTVALLKMKKENHASMVTAISGWTIPLDYQPVHKMMQELKVDPYEDYGNVELSAFVKQYLLWILTGLSAILLLVITTIKALSLNKKLVKSNAKLEQEIEERLRIENISNRLGRIIDKASDDIFIFDAKTLKIIEVNQSVIDDLGYTLAELNQMTMLDIKQDISQQAFEALLQPVRTGEAKSLSHETRHYRKDGSSLQIEDHIQYFGSETPPIFAGVAHSIEHQKKVEQALKLENLRINNTLENTSDAYFALSNDWKFTYINRKAEHLFRTRRELILEKSIWDELPELSGSFFKAFNKSLLTNECLVIEGYYPPLNKWIEARTCPLDQGITVYLNDKTNVKQITDALHINEKALDTIINSVSDGVVTLSANGNIKSFNAAAEKIFSYHADEVIGKHASILMPEHLKPTLELLFTQSKKQDNEAPDMSQRIAGLTKEGKITNLELTMHCLKNPGSDFIVGIFKKTGEQKSEIIDLQSHKNDSNK